MQINEIKEEKIKEYNTAYCWHAKKKIAKRDLIIKKIVITIITVLNFAALGAALYYVVSYCPVPASALLVSPFVAGAIAALINLKFPTLGVTADNHGSMSNPLSLIGKVVAYLFFGPLMIAVNRIDWTPYYDEGCANGISEQLEDDKISFYEINTKYGKHWKNLAKYGMVSENGHRIEEFLQLHEDYKQVKARYDHLKMDMKKVEKENKKQREIFEQKWKEFKTKVIFPQPAIPEQDYTTWTTKFSMKVKRLLRGNPIEPLQGVKF